jgi:hypothetical protein
MATQASTMEVMKLVIEQERVITGVREAARLNGGALDQSARHQLEVAAARIAELTAAITQSASATPQPSTPAPAPAPAPAAAAQFVQERREGRRSPSEDLLRAGRTVEVKSARGSTVLAEGLARPKPAAFGAWGSDDEDDEGLLGVEPRSPPTKKKRKKKKKAPASARQTPSPRSQQSSPRARPKKASPRAGAAARTASPPRSIALPDFSTITAQLMAQEGLGGASPPPSASKSVNMKYIDRLHSLHSERERNLEVVRRMEQASLQRLSSPPRSKRAQARRIEELHNEHQQREYRKQLRKAEAVQQRRLAEEEAAVPEVRRQKKLKSIAQLRKKLQSMSYGAHGQDPRKLFAHFDRDNSGTLELAEFKSAVRKGGQMTHQDITDAELRRLFAAVDTDGSGDVSIDELESFVWGSDEIDVVDQSEYSAVDGKAAATGVSRVRSPSPTAERLGSPTRAAERLLQWAEQRDKKVAARQQQMARAQQPPGTPKISRKSRQIVAKSGNRGVGKLHEWHEQKAKKVEVKRAAAADAAFERLTSPVRDRGKLCVFPRPLCLYVAVASELITSWLLLHIT